MVFRPVFQTKHYAKLAQTADLNTMTLGLTRMLGEQGAFSASGDDGSLACSGCQKIEITRVFGR